MPRQTSVPDNARLDAYWRLDYRDWTQRMLAERAGNAGYRVTKSTHKPRLVALLNRHDRSLPRYDIWNTDELQTAVRDRRLCFERTIRGQAKLSRTALTRVLTAADNSPRFDRFVQLPPEVRETIYKYAMMHHGDLLSTPTVPPLARTNKLLRQESLTLFYRLHCFKVSFSRASSAMEFSLQRDSARFLGMLGNVSSSYRNIRRLHFQFHSDFYYPGKTPGYCEFTMDLAPRSEKDLAGGVNLIDCQGDGYRESLESELGNLYKTIQALRTREAPDGRLPGDPGSGATGLGKTGKILVGGSGV